MTPVESPPANTATLKKLTGLSEVLGQEISPGLVDDLTISLQPLFERLEQFAKLKAGWDSYDAVSIAGEAIDRAARLLRLVSGFAWLVGHSALPFAVTPSPDGGVQVEWRRPNAEIEVQINPDGTFGYLHIEKSETGRQFDEGEDVPIGQILNLILRTLLS
jgi:hypothetical protein